MPNTGRNQSDSGYRGLDEEKKRLTEFEIFYKSLGQEFYIIVFLETWLNENTFNLCNIEGYVTESKHRDRIGGGVALLVKQPLEYYVREDVSFCNECIESLFIDVHLHNQPMKNDVVIGVIYRPPDTDINSFVAIITDIESTIRYQGREEDMLHTWGLQY